MEGSGEVQHATQRGKQGAHDMTFLEAIGLLIRGPRRSTRLDAIAILAIGACAQTTCNGGAAATDGGSGGQPAGGTTVGGATTTGGIIAGASGTDGRSPAAGQGGDDRAGVDSGATPAGPLVGAPLVFAATTQGFGLSVVLAEGDPTGLVARVREFGATDWGEGLPGEVLAPDLAQWQLDGLEPGTRYEYEVARKTSDEETVLYAGEAVTQRDPGEAFSFALLADSHIGAHLDFTNQGDESVLAAVSREIHAARPDFTVHLGDMLDFHEYGFNAPPPDGAVSRLAYLNYRTFLGDLPGHSAHYGVIGNWEGENGDFPADTIAWSREQRLLYVPGPTPDTYPEGGSEGEDYYAFTWGDALFVVLNVMSYTPTSHLLSTYPGEPDDWTLGAEQLAWLETTLENAQSKWRFLLIHHTVGGAAGDPANSGYGRGGGQAAYVGEQATIHQLMLDYGVQAFFYGHDHGFVDMVVDGIHYAMPGNAGAIWTFTEAETGYTQYWPESGWSRVDVSPQAVSVQFIKLGGDVLHEFTIE